MKVPRNDSYIIRQALQADLISIAQLLQGLWTLKEGKDYLSQVSWKHRNFDEKVYGTVAEHDGKVVGFLGLIPFNYQINDKYFQVLSPVDLCVDQKHRRKGLFRKMTQKGMELFADSHKFMISYSTNAVSTPGFMNMGWERVADIKHLIHFRWRKVLGCTSPLQESEGKLGSGFWKLTKDPNTYFKVRASLLVTPSDCIVNYWNTEEFIWRVSSPLENYWFVTVCDDRTSIPCACCVLRETHGMFQLADWVTTSECTLCDLFVSLNSVLKCFHSTFWTIPISRTVEQQARKHLYFDMSRVIRTVRRTSFVPGMIARPTVKNFTDKDWKIDGLDIRQAEAWRITPLGSL